MKKNNTINQKINQFANSVPTDPYFYWVTFLKHKKQLLFIPFLFSILSLFIFMNIQPLYKSKASLILDKKENNIINIEPVYSDFPQNNNQTFLNTQKEIILSNQVLDRVFGKKLFFETAIKNFNNFKPTLVSRILFKKDLMNENFLKEYIKANLNASSSRDSNVIDLEFNSQSPEFSRFILQEIISAYLEYDIDQKISVTTYANLKIKERLDELKNNLELSEEKLQIFKTENKLIDLGDIKNLKNDEIKSISSRIVKAEKELQVLQNDLQQISLTSNDIEELSALKIIKEQKEVEKIMSNLEANNNTIDSLKLIYKDSHPKLSKALKTSENLQDKLEEIIQNNIASRVYEVANLESFIDLSEKELDKSREELQILEINDLEMQKYSREVDLNKRIYESFLERLKETSEAKELQTPNAKILDLPIFPDKPYSPNIKFNSILTFFVTMVGLYCLIAYYETFRNIISSPSNLEDNDFELLNIIPKTLTKKGYHLPMNFLENQSSKFSEAIISLKTILLSKYNSSKVFMISSAVAGEGKTTISLNLALSLATSHKVLFLETDFRRPSLMKSLNLDYRDGLIDLFNGNVSFSKIKFNIYSTKLDIISAGKPSYFNQNITEDKLEKFIEVLKPLYDFIIVDTAPILPVADTLIMSKIADTVLLVVKSEYTRIAGLINSKKKIEAVSNAKVSTILNYFDTENANYYNYSNYGNYYNKYYNYNKT